MEQKIQQQSRLVEVRDFAQRLVQSRKINLKRANLILNQLGGVWTVEETVSILVVVDVDGVVSVMICEDKDKQ